MDEDNESLMDHCALEAMNAIEGKDAPGFRDAFHILITDIIQKLQNDLDSKE